MQYLLDTNICIFFLRGKMNLDKIIKEKGKHNCFISEITVFELRFGAEVWILRRVGVSFFK
jgi:tRNA(fMet)-specific endonuclease VapC